MSALALDVNVSALGVAGTGTVTSPSFTTTSANELLLAFAWNDSATAINTPTGAGLTWASVGSVAGGGVFSTIAIFRAFASTILTSQTVTVTAGASDNVAINVVSFSGADATGTNGSGAIGATGSAQDTIGVGALSKAITTTRAGSWVWAGASDGDTAATFTAGTNQTINNQRAVGASGGAVLKQNARTTASGTSVTMNYTLSGAGDRSGIFVLEILPSYPSFISNHLRPHAFSPGLAR